MKKKLPAAPLRIDSRFAKAVEHYHAKFKGAKPEDMEDAHRIAALVFATLHDNLSAYNFLRDAAPLPAAFEDQPRNRIEHWLRIFLRFPDYSLGLMAKARAELAKYGPLERALFKASVEGTLDQYADGDLMQHAGNRSDDGVQKVRQRWTKSQAALDEKRR